MAQGSLIYPALLHRKPCGPQETGSSWDFSCRTICVSLLQDTYHQNLLSAQLLTLPPAQQAFTTSSVLPQMLFCLLPMAIPRCSRQPQCIGRKFFVAQASMSLNPKPVVIEHEKPQRDEGRVASCSTLHRTSLSGTCFEQRLPQYGRLRKVYLDLNLDQF